MPSVSSKPGRDGRSTRSRNSTPTTAIGTSSLSSERTHASLDPARSFSALSSRISLISDTVLQDIFANASTGSSPPSAVTLASIIDTIKSQLISPLTLRTEACEVIAHDLSRRRKDLSSDRDHADRDASSRRPGAASTPKSTRLDSDRLESQKEKTKVPTTESGSPRSTPSETASPTKNHLYFGNNPLTFPDPTTYELRKITPGMSVDEKRKIFGVAHFPHDDLRHLTPGTPPDKDFSNSKPSNQVSAQAFANYVEPYMRPFTEEDLNFLRERGDRATPFIVPPRGLRHYKEIWADEDSALSIKNEPEKSTSSEPRRRVDMINDSIAETDQVSIGPAITRVLQALRPEGRQDELNHALQMPITNGTLGNGAEAHDENLNPNGSNASSPLPSATTFPEFTNGVSNGGPSFARSPSVPKLAYPVFDERVLLELRHIGFIGPDETPDYGGHYDDEIAARLRYLQSELRAQSLINGARKARLLELTELHMAKQEYSSISEDLDGQLNSAYLKRNRTIGKSRKNQKRPGASGSGSGLGVNSGPGLASNVSKPAVSEPIRALKDRRLMWRNVIGPVVEFGETKIPEHTIFDLPTMEVLIEREKELWATEQNGQITDDLCDT